MLPRRCATNLKFLPRHRCRRRRILCLICSSPMTPRRLFCPFFPPPSSLCRVHTTPRPRKTNEQSSNRASRLVFCLVFSLKNPFMCIKQRWQIVHERYFSLFNQIYQRTIIFHWPELDKP